MEVNSRKRSLRVSFVFLWYLNQYKIMEIVTNENFRCGVGPILFVERTLEHACDISIEKIKLS